MTLRQLPGAIVLGLVAALTAHAVLFGGEHAWGGAYHSALVQFTLAATTSIITAAGALLWSGARGAADGTVLAARLRELLPGWGAVLTSGAACYVLGERLEAAHASVPLLAIVVVLALAAWLVLRFTSVALRALAGIVFAIVRGVMRREQSIAWRPSTTPLRGFAQDDKPWRRFTRPPPVTANA